MDHELREGDEVKWAVPLNEGEQSERFTLIERNGDRGFIRFVCDMAIPPVQVAKLADLVLSKRESSQK